MVSEHSNPPSMNQRGWTILIRRGLQWCKALCLIWDLLSLHFATINMDPHHAGTSQPSGATLACEPCLKGEYQDLTGQQTCKRCDVGYYQDEERGPICKSALETHYIPFFNFSPFTGKSQPAVSLKFQLANASHGVAKKIKQVLQKVY